MDQEKSGKPVAWTAYALNLAGYFTLVPLFASLVLNWLKKDDADSGYAEHHRYMLRSFVGAVVGYMVAVMMAFTLVLIPFAWLLGIATSLWGVYRDVRGVLALWEGRAP